MKPWWYAFVMGVLFLAACNPPWTTFSDRVIEHDPVEMAADNLFFEEKGCFQSIDCLPESLRTLEPPITGISRVSNWFGGFPKSIPIAIAYTSSAFQEDESTFLYARHCLLSYYVRYLVYMDGVFRVITTRERLGKIFAPIDTPEKAFSLAIAATGFYPLNNLEANPKIKLEQEQIEESFVMQTSEGYLVHLFTSKSCGCGPHMVDSVDVTVHTDGSLEIGTPVPAFHDPDLDNVCFD